jgi:hypothetical protein
MQQTSLFHNLNAFGHSVHKINQIVDKGGANLCGGYRPRTPANELLPQLVQKA